MPPTYVSSEKTVSATDVPYARKCEKDLVPRHRRNFGMSTWSDREASLLTRSTMESWSVHQDRSASATTTRYQVKPIDLKLGMPSKKSYHHSPHSPRSLLSPDSTLDVIEESDATRLDNSSPSTPPKKVWERSYRNFLKLRKAPPPPMDRVRRATSVDTSSLQTNSNATTRESSVRGGKLFSGVFRNDVSTPQRNRRVKSLSAHELDGTMRRGAEKAYSPAAHQRVAPSASMPQFEEEDDRVVIRPRASSSLDDRVPPRSSVQTTQAQLLEAPQLRTVTSMPFTTNSNDSTSPHLQVDETDLLDASSSSAMKKAFTEFHNSSSTGRDAVSAYLGDEPSLYGNSSLLWTAQNTIIKRSSMGHADDSAVAASKPASLTSYTDLGGMMLNSVRTLKAIQGAETWQPNRRYLIAPATLAASPISVMTILSPHSPKSPQDGDAASSILLGPCEVLCHLGPVVCPQWSSVVLVLRQNYLLEYADSNIRGMPRGYAHLEFAKCMEHPDFHDTLELHFYGSPCAKSDQRIILIRVEDREQRTCWKDCLNRAANLKIEDLYELGDELGKGSYATVYSGKRKGSKEPCALKVFDKSKYWKLVVKGRERADTIVREASVQATFTARCGKVPSFVRIRGFFETSDSVVLELELLEGTDLFKYILSKGVLKEHEAALISRDILHSLQAMNRIGLAHRDIKPANVLMCPGQHGPSCKVADFGMSTFVGVDGQLRGRCGTPGYVAPEIFLAGLHGGYGNKVDVFSAGVTLYVMLCGYEPFYGETDAELVQANKDAQVEYPEEDWKNVSAEARDLVEKMLRKDPKQRLDASQALKHPWFQKILGGSSSLDDSTSLPVVEVPAEDACVIS